MAIRIGCGSWSDQAYVGVLYPPGLPPAQRLGEYAKHFDHVEVNSSYYATPKKAVVETWIRQTPSHFLFDLKLHRNLLSSVTKSRGDKAASKKDLLSYLLEQVKPLIRAKKFGLFILLMPPRFGPEKHGLEELDVVVERIKPHPLAVELRHADWVNAKNRAGTLAYFRERGLTWVSTDMPKMKDTSIMPAMDEVTQPKLAYLRLHGRNKKYLEAESAEERHTYLYDERELKEIATRIKRLAAKAADVRVVANNHAQDFAPRTAFALKRLLGQKG